MTDLLSSHFSTPRKFKIKYGNVLLLFVIQLLSPIWLFATPLEYSTPDSLSFTISWSLLKLMSIESVMPSKHLILCCPLLLPSVLPSIRVFSNDWFFTSGGQSIGASASASVLLMNIQGWSPLGLTGLISFLFKGLTKVFSINTIQMFKKIKIMMLNSCVRKESVHVCIFCSCNI